MRFKVNIAILVLVAFPLTAASIQETKPETVGLSKERLQRIHETIQRHIDGRQIAGAVTLVARKGHIAHLEAHGAMDLDSKKPMAKDSIFRIYSMSKPIAGVAEARCQESEVRSQNAEGNPVFILTPDSLDS